jgi:hypothetical protein
MSIFHLGDGSNPNFSSGWHLALFGDAAEAGLGSESRRVVLRSWYLAAGLGGVAFSVALQLGGEVLNETPASVLKMRWAAEAPATLRGHGPSQDCPPRILRAAGPGWRIGYNRL